ncbi:CehA/McbA family metallohydrolase [Hansschlegelia sp. KR7-227]|uniref:CehA/McbA family metallohydrolase n=1 Tax=Hansschlegelia sp. KR7-227 TaxID=3400914 RepID=UPI003C12B538
MSVSGVQKARFYRRLASGVKVAAAAIILAAGTWQFGFASPWTAPSFGALEAFLSVTFDGDRQFQLSWGPKPDRKTAERPSQPALPAQAAAAPSTAVADEPAKTPAAIEKVAAVPAAPAAAASLAVCALSARSDGETRAIISRASIEAGGGAGVIDGFGVRDASLVGPGAPASSGYILPLLASIRSQGGLSGLKPALPSTRTPGVEKLPNTRGELTDGSGAFALSVAHNALDMLQVGGGSYVEELNPWYHSLNAGMRTQIVGGMTCSAAADVEVASAGAKGPSAQLEQIRKRFDEQNLYVSDGRSAVADFTVGGHRPDRRVGAEVKLAMPGPVKISATLSASLPAQPSPAASGAGGWSVERARYGATRSVNVEIVSNGKVVATKPLPADGALHSLEFEIPVERSSWVALRLMGGGHSNPVYVLVDNAPIRASRSSVEWSQRALLQAFDSQSGGWPATDAAVAAAAFQYAYAVYDGILKESEGP